MKVCIPLRRPVLSSNLREDNLRTEERWERLVLEASISNPAVDEIFTTGCDWTGGGALSTKYKGSIKHSEANDTILLIHDCKLEIISSMPWKAVIANIFAGPWVEQIDLVQVLARKYADKFMFSVGYPGLYQQESVLSHLKNFIEPSNLILLPVPGVPAVSPGNNFLKSQIIWACRIIFIGQLENPAISWALGALKNDPSLNLLILTGTEEQAIFRCINQKAEPLEDTLENCFWNLPASAPYQEVRDRVLLSKPCSWMDVLGHYSQSKVMATWGKQMGHPAIEAASHGVPFVGTGLLTGGSLVACRNYLHTIDISEFCATMNRLLVDETFYTETANAYRDYVAATYTYEAFNNNLNTILESRGLLV